MTAFPVSGSAVDACEAEGKYPAFPDKQITGLYFMIIPEA